MHFVFDNPRGGGPRGRPIRAIRPDRRGGGLTLPVLKNHLPMARGLRQGSGSDLQGSPQNPRSPMQEAPHTSPSPNGR